MHFRVVDASALGALLFGETQAEEVVERLEGADLVAPAILWFEVASICLKKIKEQPSAKEKIISAFMLFPSLAIQQVEVNHTQVIELARVKKLTTYDASYLWLASKLQAELVTLDKKLLRTIKVSRRMKRL